MIHQHIFSLRPHNINIYKYISFKTDDDTLHPFASTKATFPSIYRSINTLSLPVSLKKKKYIHPIVDVVNANEPRSASSSSSEWMPLYIYIYPYFSLEFFLLLLLLFPHLITLHTLHFQRQTLCKQSFML